MTNSSIEQTNNTHSENVEYGANSIKVLKGLDAVRKRPGMYIGDTEDGSGLHHMVYEVVDNSIDEALADYCDRIDVILNKDDSCTIKDNGRGIPVEIHTGEGISAAEVIMTQLHAGGKFDDNTYKVSGGLHGVGISVVNALSQWLKLTIFRNDKIYFIEFVNGVTVAPLRVIGDAVGQQGTHVTFKPSSKIFSKIVLTCATLEHRLRELAFLNKDTSITLEDHRSAEPQIKKMHYHGGVSEFVQYLDRNKQTIVGEQIVASGERNNITIDIALQWNDSYHENVLCFTNNIPQRDGGTHLAGLRTVLTRQINSYIAASNIPKKDKLSITGEDTREGLTCVLSLKIHDPKFTSQTKDKLVSSEVRPVIETILGESLSTWFEEHPTQTRAIINKICEAAISREAARKARELTRRSGVLEINTSLENYLTAKNGMP